MKKLNSLKAIVLNLKKPFAPFFTLMVFSLLIVSCGQQENAIIEEVPSVPEVEIADQIAVHPAFVESMEIVSSITEEVVEFVEANQALINEDPSVIENFIAGLAQQESLFEQTEILAQDFPQLADMTNEEVGKITQNASRLQVGATDRSCQSNCNAARADLEAQYYGLYYQAALDCYNAGGGTWAQCNNFWYGWFLGHFYNYIIPSWQSCMSQC